MPKASVQPQREKPQITQIITEDTEICFAAFAFSATLRYRLEDGFAAYGGSP